MEKKYSLQLLFTSLFAGYYSEKTVILWTVFAADAALMQTQTLYTEATPEQLEQLQQQGIQYDVITFTDE